MPDGEVVEGNRPFRVEAIVAQSAGMYLVTLDLPGRPGVRAPFRLEPPEYDELAVLHPPAVVIDAFRADIRPLRPLFKAVGAFHDAAVAVPTDLMRDGWQPVRLRALRIDHGSSYVGTVRTLAGDTVESRFVVHGPGSAEWSVPVPADLLRFAGPGDENVARVLRAVIKFHTAVRSQM